MATVELVTAKDLNGIQEANQKILDRLGFLEGLLQVSVSLAKEKQDRYMSANSMAAYYDIGVSTWWEWVRDGKVPPAEKIGSNTSRWRLAEVEQALQARGQQKGEGKI